MRPPCTTWSKKGPYQLHSTCQKGPWYNAWALGSGPLGLLGALPSIPSFRLGEYFGNILGNFQTGASTNVSTMAQFGQKVSIPTAQNLLMGFGRLPGHLEVAAYPLGPHPAGLNNILGIFWVLVIARYCKPLSKMSHPSFAKSTT